MSWLVPDFTAVLWLLEHSRISCVCFKAQLHLTSYTVLLSKSPLTGRAGRSFSKFPFMARHDGKCTVSFFSVIPAKYEDLIRSVRFNRQFSSADYKLRLQDQLVDIRVGPFSPLICALWRFGPALGCFSSLQYTETEESTDSGDRGFGRQLWGLCVQAALGRVSSTEHTSLPPQP